MKLNQRVRIAIAAIGAFVAIGAGATACGHDRTYYPAAYGESGHCYYVDTPAEATALIVAGLCPTGWVAYPMPVYWHAQYSWFYDSDRYYNTYVPVASRTVYVSHVTVFKQSHQADISRLTPSGKVQDSKRKQYTGAQVLSGPNGGGARGSGNGGARSSGYSGGTARSSTSGSTSRSRSSSGSYGGGARSGGGRK